MRSVDILDASRGLFLLTESYGLMAFYLPHIRKSKRRSLVACSIGSLLNLSFAASHKEWKQIKTFDVISTANFLSQDYKDFVLFMFLNQILLAILVPENPNRFLFRLHQGTIDFLREAKATDRFPKQLLVVFYLLRLLHAEGLLPLPTSCEQCQTPIAERAIYSDGEGFLCPSCGEHREGFLFHREMLDFLRFAVRNRFHAVLEKGFSPSVLAVFKFLIDQCKRQFDNSQLVSLKPMEKEFFKQWGAFG